MSTTNLAEQRVPAERRGERRDERYAYRLPVTLVRGHEEIPLSTEDVSYHGLFLETDDVPPLRHLVRLKLLLPPFHRELQAFGMAVHRGRGPGVGVQLYALDRTARTVWSNFVTRVRLGDLGDGRVDWSQLADGLSGAIRFLEPEIVEG